MTKVHPERVNPEVVRKFGIANGDVTGDAFIESIAGKQAKCSG
jgi:hypothetical protein